MALPRTTKDRNYLQSTQTTVNQHTDITDQAPGTMERAAQESRRLTPISTAAVHASSTATTRHHNLHPTGSTPNPLSQRRPLRNTGGLTRTTTQTQSASAGTRSAPRLGGPISRVANGQLRAPGHPLRRGRREGGGRGDATALRTQRPELAASADPGARTAPRRGQHFRQGHRLEQAAQGGPVDHLGALATVLRRGPTVRCRGIASWKVQERKLPADHRMLCFGRNSRTAYILTYA